MTADPVVEIRDLVKTYGGRTVVDRLTLSAARGAITAVLGPNGAGKTTTIECCEGLRIPDAGSVRVLGLDPHTDAVALRPRVGVMLQDSGLPAQKRAGDVLAHVARMYRDPWPVADLTERLGLGSFAATSVRRLSGGQRQRLAMACALVGRPEVVFLDEPSAGMDPQSRLAVWDLARALRAQGTSVILTTHLMDEAAELADDVIVVDHGRVVAQGPPAVLTAQSAGQVATMSTAAPLDPTVPARLREHLGGEGWDVTAPDAKSLRIDGALDPRSLAAILAFCAAEDVLVTRLDLGTRSLEDYFLDLTGRTMR
ncbi:ABC transporter ATP-binding protein [Sanguibacter sp. A247]|uniref:ABC transporter ATP-binding protein n=1 Tax=unclassified Sanguibacter TaxID=2645534 RepID=UPI003FD7CE34